MHLNNKRSIRFYVNQYLHQIKQDLANKTVIDMPAGQGVTSMICHQLGADVKAYDLFPEYFALDEVTCHRANIMESLPVNDGMADFFICQEGYEHFSDQIKALKEINRCLKKNGILILTTPSYSSLQSKLSNLFFENEHSKRMPPNEIDDIWMSEPELSNEQYYGHVFLSGIQRIRCLAKFSGLEIKEIRPNVISKQSLILLPFFYPLILLSSLRTYFKSLKNPLRKSDLESNTRKKIYWEQFLTNINPVTLSHKHLFLVLVKDKDLDEIKPLSKDNMISFKR